MNAEYYIENDITIGPTTLADLAERFRRAGNEPYFVWTEGMSDWAGATAVSDVSKLLQTVPKRPSSRAPTTHFETASPQKAPLVQRARRELAEYVTISAYLFVRRRNWLWQATSL
jgi:hypothetical protein